MSLDASSSNYGAIGLNDGTDVLKALGNDVLSTILSMPVRKGQGVMVHYNGGTNNSFMYYPFKS